MKKVYLCGAVVGFLMMSIIGCGDKSTGQAVKMELVFVKGGCYQMGDTFGDGEKDEKPVHEVCLSDFYMGKYEVTQGQWEKVMGNNPSQYNGFFQQKKEIVSNQSRLDRFLQALIFSCGDDCPVENVSWNDTQEFIRKLNAQSGKNYRLPTEAEWEYAARSGGKKEKWAGTSDEASLGDYVWYGHKFRFFTEWKTHPVGKKKPNGLGIYDMSGNVQELCSDWYRDKYYSESPRDNAKGPDSGSFRVLRGGGWLDNAQSSRVANRNRFSPDYRNDFLTGFRVAVPSP